MSSTATDPVTETAEEVADSPWGDRLARLGLTARGVVYLGLAYLIARIAAGALGGAGSKPASGPGVADALVTQPGGRAVVGILAVGLALYALFSLLDAILHHDDESNTAKRWGLRALSLWGFVLYGIFAVYCVYLAFSSSAGNHSASQSNQQKKHWSAEVLAWPAGWLWLALVAAVLFVISGFLLHRALRRSFASRLHRQQMTLFTWRLAMTLGVVGLIGRTLMFGTVGGFILTAAVQNDPNDGQGVDGAVRQLAQSGAGTAYLWVLAVLLAIFALYLFVEMRYRRV
jgi:hypothetical protein